MMRKIHFDDDVWYYHYGKRYLRIKSPENKSYDVLLDHFWIRLLGIKEYLKRLENTNKWTKYSWDKYVVPNDFDLEPILRFSPFLVKKYIQEFIINDNEN
jgi:hypothetical protein